MMMMLVMKKQFLGTPRSSAAEFSIMSPVLPVVHTVVLPVVPLVSAGNSLFDDAMMI
jgi:hypothetical protein